MNLAIRASGFPRCIALHKDAPFFTSVLSQPVWNCVELIIAAGNEVDYAEDYILELSTLGLSGLVIERPIILTDWRQRCWPVDLIHRPLIFLNLL